MGKTAATLWLALALTLAAGGCSHSSFPQQARGKPALTERRFVILQVNDTYKIEGLEKGSLGGFARLRTLRRQLEASGDPVLLLHAGDFLYPSVMSKYLRAEPMVSIMNLLDGTPAGFDPNLVVTFGNHEFDNPDPGVLLGRIAQSDFSWVSSNVSYRSAPHAPSEELSHRLHQVHDVLVRDVGGVRVGLFGLTLDTDDQDYVAYQYDPQQRRRLTQDAIARLKQQGAEVIVALTHQDLAQDEWLAREFPEITLIAGGHEHFFIQERIGRTWITKADADNQSAVVHEVALAPNGSATVTPRKVALDSSVPKDPEVQTEVERYKAQLNQALKQETGRDGAETIGQTRHLLEGVETAIRSRETALGNFLADAVRERLKTDVAFINGGGIRLNDNIPPGPITYYDLEGIFYFDDCLVTTSVTGAQLLEILRNSVSMAHLGRGRFLQVGGIRFRYQKSGDDRKPDYRIDAEDVSVRRFGSHAYAPLEPRATYTAGTTDFIWNFGYKDGYTLFQRGKGGTSPKRLDNGPLPDFRRVVEEAIARLPGRTVASDIDGRIQQVSPDRIGQ